MMLRSASYEDADYLCPDGDDNEQGENGEDGDGDDNEEVRYEDDDVLDGDSRVFEGRNKEKDNRS